MNPERKKGAWKRETVALKSSLAARAVSRGPDSRRPPSRLRRFLPSSRGPSIADLATPDHAPATARAYAHDWDDFAAFCGRHDLEPLPAAPQTLALYLKALETRRSRSPAGIRAGTVGLSLPTPRLRLAAIASRHATAGLETATEHSCTPHRAAAGDSYSDARQPAGGARSGAAAARLCRSVSAQRARGARRRAAAVLESGVLCLDCERAK